MNETILKLRDQIRGQDTLISARITQIESELRQCELGVPIQLGPAIWCKVAGVWRLCNSETDYPLSDSPRTTRVEFLEWVQHNSISAAVREQLEIHIERREKLLGETP